MKNLFFILGSLAFITCSEDDSDQRANFDYTVLNMDEAVGIGLAEFPYLANGDTISKTYAYTNAEKMTFELLEETVPGALKMDPETGIITVNDARLFISDENLNEPNMAITIKAKAGVRSKIQKQSFKIYDVSTCEGSSAFLEQNIYGWVQLNAYLYEEESIDAAAFSFVMPEAKTLCNFLYGNAYITEEDSKINLVFIDEAGSEIFNEFIDVSLGDLFTPSYYNKKLDLTLLPNKKYTCRISFESKTRATIIEGGTSSPIRFPINQSLYKITETNLLDGTSNLQNTGLIPVVLGFE